MAVVFFDAIVIDFGEVGSNQYDSCPNGRRSHQSRVGVVFAPVVVVDLVVKDFDMCRNTRAQIGQEKDEYAADIASGFVPVDFGIDAVLNLDSGDAVIDQIVPDDDVT